MARRKSEPKLIGEWGDADYYEVAVYWPGEGGYGGRTICKTLEEARAEVGRIIANKFKPVRVHIRRVRTERIDKIETGQEIDQCAD